jgi:site-specific DNA-cytosine methylase
VKLGEPNHPKPESRERCALCSIEGVADTRNPYGWRKFNQATRRLVHHRASPTLTKSQVPGSDLPFAGNERIGDKRAAVIASFPGKFVFAGSWKDAINRIGNSVPPLFMRAIADHIRKEILHR